MRSTSCGLQVATDTRLWLYGALQDTRGYLADLIKTAINRAEVDVDVIMPGFTHLQVCVILGSAVFRSLKTTYYAILTPL